MSSRSTVFAVSGAVLALAVAAAVFLWSSAQPRGRIIEDGSRAPVRQTAKDDTPAASAPEEKSPQTGTGGAVVTAQHEPKPQPATRQPFDMSQLAEGDVLVRAKVALSNPGGLQVMHAAARLPAFLVLRWVQEDRTPNEPEFSFELDGVIEAPCSMESFPIKDGALLPAEWSARIAWGEREDFVTIKAPKLEGRVLDFGTLEFDLGAFMGEDEWLFVGRMVHTTGLPIDYFETLSLSVGSRDSRLWFEMNGDGSFTCSHWGPYAPDDPVSLVVYDEDDEDVRRLPKPKISGRIVELGDVVLDCAAVEIRLAAWPDDNARRQRLGLAADAELSELSMYVYFNTYYASLTAELAQPETTRVKFLHPGAYRYQTDIQDRTFAWRQVTGVVNLEAGKLEKIDIALEQVHGVFVRFQAPEPLSRIDLDVFIVNGDGDIEDGAQWQLASHNLPITIPNTEHRPMRLTAKARGYAPVEAEVGGDATEVLLEFKERVPADTGFLVLELPEVPDFFRTDANATDIAIMASITNARGSTEKRMLATYSSQANIWGRTEAGRYLKFEVPVGVTKVWLQETGKAWGYPKGIISGPVEGTVRADLDCHLKIPGFGTPPWAKPVRHCYGSLTCEGKAFSYTGAVLLDNERQYLTLSLGAPVFLSAGAYALPDGNNSLELEMFMPPDDEGKMYLRRDLAARVEIRMLRGKDLAPWPLGVTAYCGGDNTGIFAQSDTNGKIRFWAPLGRARVSISALGGATTVEREIEVTENLKVIEIKDEGSYVHFVWQSPDAEQEASAWWLLDEKGDPVNMLTPQFTTLKTPPGRYTMIPENRDKPEVAFVVTEGTDTTVEVPLVPPLAYTASILVKYPKDFKPSPDGAVLEWLWYVPITGDPDKDIRLHDYATQWGNERFRPEGIKITGLPLNVEFVLVLAMTNNGENGEPNPGAWAIAPIRLKLTETSIQTLTVAWKAAVVLDESWFEFGQVDFFGENGLRYVAYNRILLPGAYTARFYAGETPVDHSVVLKAEGKYSVLPPEIRKALGGDDGD